MKHISFFFIVFFAHRCFASLGCTPPDTILPDFEIPQEKVWLIKAMIEDEKKLWTSPVKITNREKIYWVPVIGATIIALSRDEKIYSEFKSFQSKHQWVSDISPVITYGGENVTAVSLCGLFYFGGLVFHDTKATQTGMLAAQALVHSGIIVTVGKYITGRQRPSEEKGKDHWHWFPTSMNAFKKGHSQARYDAFPSGHTIAAWSVATVIAKQYKDKKIIPVICYALAAGVGLSRITEDAHWMSDVIVGAAMGYSIGNFMVRERANTKFTFFPVTDGVSVSIGAAIKL